MIPKERIGAFFITPCPAKVTWVREANKYGIFPIDGAISISEAYGEIKKRLPEISPPYPELRASPRGIGWGRSGGERIAARITKSLVVDGIHSVIEVLEQLEMGKLSDIEFVEAQACIGGCVGGALTVLNPFIARMNLESLVDNQRSSRSARGFRALNLTERLCEFTVKPDIVAVPAFGLDQDVSRAITKAEMIESSQ